MAQHSWRQGPKSLEINEVRLYAVLTFDGSGDVTVTQGKGIASVTHDGTGLYTVNFKYPYLGGVLGLDAVYKVASTGISAAPVVGIVADTAKSLTAPGFQMCTAMPHDSTTTTLEAANPGDGEVLYLAIDLARSNLV